jgi:TolB-like protein/Tfp pilus assembly protein PilF
VDLVFAGHEIDLRRQELRRAGEVVHVEPQVYDLLLHLIHHRDRVVSKDELLDTIWNGRIVSEAALSSRINAARKAIGDDGDRQALIKTIHRRGFRFIGVVQEATIATDARVDTAPSPESVAATRKPSIAVLPFTNLSQEHDTDYFSYGLTEDVIRLLARYRWLDVLSRHSAVAYKDQAADPRDIGAALGIRYLVQGTVAKHVQRVRITADLVSTETGHHLWGESYDLALADILDVQKTMSEQIAAAIEPELSRLEREAAVRRPPVNLGAWDCYQRGLYHLWGFTTPGLVEGADMFRHATELDPTFGRAFGALAYAKLQILILRSAQERPALLEDALRDARTAVALDDHDCMNYCIVGRLLCLRHEYEEAVAYLEHCIRINPSFAQGYFALGFTLIAGGRAREAVAYLERSIELSPRDPHLPSCHAIRAMGHLSLGELDLAEEFARKATRYSNSNHWPFSVLASVLGLLGHTEEARRTVDTMLEHSPSFTLEAARSELFYCGDNGLTERYLDGLRRAGLGEAANGPLRRGTLHAA